MSGESEIALIWRTISFRFLILEKCHLPERLVYRFALL